MSISQTILAVDIPVRLVDQMFAMRFFFVWSDNKRQLGTIACLTTFSF